MQNDGPAGADPGASAPDAPDPPDPIPARRPRRTDPAVDQTWLVHHHDPAPSPPRLSTLLLLACFLAVLTVYLLYAPAT
ncbi:hypothetical protein D5S18_18050 [Nocardia panacis]|uniref:Uncharacterized protein n=1 Tax=Nocardia panacis TaxID=2340916 RepID=A0A3A4KKL9_9NOCA|nr:hypothetical protein [Nocardia panacis]RJO75251.1 hypothetical protein D5S18_18050 [Nocardia panacis]